MNPVFTFLERIATGPEIEPADEVILEFGNGGPDLTRRNLTESVLGLAGTGKGKTTLLRTLARSMLRDQWGGLVLSVKGSQIEEFKDSCRLEGREKDCLVLSANGVHTFNPLVAETSASEAAALLSEIAEVLAGRVRDGGESDAFWREQLGIILRNLFTLCRVAHGRFDLVKSAELFDARANTLAELEDPRWREASVMNAALEKARQSPDDDDSRLAVEYFTRSFPCHGDRLQGSLAATVSSVFDFLRRQPLRKLFSGESTFSMDDLLDHGKICIVGIPVLDSTDGKIANAILPFCFCRSATRRSRSHYSFLISDECQETVSRELMRKLAVLREFKVASIFLTQNISVLDDKIGEVAREGFCALLNLKIFGTQGHAGTREWASNQIGKRKFLVGTKSKGYSGGQSNSGTSDRPEWDFRVPPSRFAALPIGQTICLRDGNLWLAKWHATNPGKQGTVRISDG